MGSDLSRGAGGVQHARVGKLLGVGVARGNSAHDPHAQAKHDGPSHRAHAAFLEGEVAGGAVLEVQIRVLSARGQCHAQQPLRDARVDGIQRCGWKRKDGVRVHFTFHESTLGRQS